jgi:hypothetical protein
VCVCVSRHASLVVVSIVSCNGNLLCEVVKAFSPPAAWLLFAQMTFSLPEVSAL